MSTCPVCSDELSSESTLCVLCETPHDTECWDYNGKCAAYGCGSKVHGKEVATLDDFVKDHLEPAYDKVSALLWGTPHRDRASKCEASYDAGVNGVITPAVAHNQLLEELRVWKDYYRGRMESLAAASPLVASILEDPGSCKVAFDGSAGPKSLDYLRALNNIVEALETPHLRLEETVYSYKEMFIGLGLGVVYTVGAFVAATYANPLSPFMMGGAAIAFNKSRHIDQMIGQNGYQTSNGNKIVQKIHIIYDSGTSIQLTRAQARR